MLNFNPFERAGEQTVLDHAVIDYIMPRVSDGALRILLYIIRCTDGSNRMNAPISYRQFMEATGIGAPATVRKALAELMNPDTFGFPLVLKQDGKAEGVASHSATRYALNKKRMERLAGGGDSGGSLPHASKNEASNHATENEAYASNNEALTLQKMKPSRFKNCSVHKDTLYLSKESSSCRVTGVSQNARVTATKTTPTTAPGLTPVAWPSDLDPNDPDWLAFVNVTRPFADAPPDIQAEMLRSFDWMRQVAIPVPFTPANAEIYLKRFVAKNSRFPHPDEVCRTWAKMMADLAEGEPSAPQVEIPSSLPFRYHEEVSDLAKRNPGKCQKFLEAWGQLDDETRERAIYRMDNGDRVHDAVQGLGPV